MTPTHTNPGAPSQAFMAPLLEQEAKIDRYAYLIGKHGFLSPMDEAIELLEMQPVYWVPSLAPHVRGITSVHGFLTPVLDLNILFEGVPQHHPRWLLVLGKEQAAVALQIAGLPMKKRLSCMDRQTPENCPALLDPHILGAYPDSVETRQEGMETLQARTWQSEQTDASDAAEAVWLDFNHRSYFESSGAFFRTE